MVVPRPKPRKGSPVFEQQNLERLKKCSDTVSRAEKAIREAQKLLDASEKLTRQTRKIR